MTDWNLVRDRDVPIALQSVPSDEVLPDAVDVVVIGGGIIGASAAYYLTKMGHKVALVEKGFIGAEQSSRNWGWCRQQNRDERELPLMKASLDIWNGLNKDLGGETGFRRHGLLYLTDKPEELETWGKWVDLAAGYDVRSRMLTAAEARELAPNVAGKWIGGVHSPTDGQAEPMLAAPAFAIAARRLGATLHQQCAARGLSFAAGRIEGVVTERGMIRTGTVLCASGAWATMFCGWHGVHFPTTGARGTVFSTGRAPKVVKGGLSTPFFTVRPNLEGGYSVAIRGRAQIDITPQSVFYGRDFWKMLRARGLKGMKLGLGASFFRGPGSIAKWTLDSRSPFEKMRVLNPHIDDDIIQSGLAALIEAYPELRGVEVARKWAGLMDSTPDGIPVISAVPEISGFHVAAGFSGHGFGIGPGAGKLAAEIVSGKPTLVDIADFDLARFAKGKATGAVAQF